MSCGRRPFFFLLEAALVTLTAPPCSSGPKSATDQGWNHYPRRGRRVLAVPLRRGERRNCFLGAWEGLLFLLRLRLGLRLGLGLGFGLGLDLGLWLCLRLSLAVAVNGLCNWRWCCCGGGCCNYSRTPTCRASSPLPVSIFGGAAAGAIGSGSSRAIVAREDRSAARPC